jgi:Domain of unknown function (DUF4124)
MRALILTLMMVLASAAAAGEIYRWVDEDGSVHYGDYPPEGMELTAETVAIQRPGGLRRPSDEEETPEVGGIRLDDPVMQQRCTLSQEILASYLAANTLIQRDQDTGEETVLTADQRAEEIAKAQQQVSTFCLSSQIQDDG